MRIASAFGSGGTWAARECIRRVMQQSGSPCDTALVSFPRSGSHLARALIEFRFLQPTLGDGDSTQRHLPRNLADRPILERLGLGGRYVSRSPILVKRHLPPSRSEFPRQLFLVRPYSQAVLSHLRDVPDSALTDRDVIDAADQWVQVVQAANKREGETLVVPFEELVQGAGDERVLEFVAGSSAALRSAAASEPSEMVADQARRLLNATRTAAPVHPIPDLDHRRRLLKRALDRPSVQDVFAELDPRLRDLFT